MKLLSFDSIVEVRFLQKRGDPFLIPPTIDINIFPQKFLPEQCKARVNALLIAAASTQISVGRWQFRGEWIGRVKWIE